MAMKIKERSSEDSLFWTMVVWRMSDGKWAVRPFGWLALLDENGRLMRCAENKIIKEFETEEGAREFCARKNGGSK